MSDSNILLPNSDRIDAELLTVAGTPVKRERDQIAGVNADDIAAVTDVDPAPSLHGLVVRPLNVENPIRSVGSITLAAGASGDIDFTAIGAGKTGKLQCIIVASTVPGKWQLKTRDGGVQQTIGICFTGGLSGQPSFRWEPPDKRYDTIAHASGDENFRITVTNLDQQNETEFYATSYFDECD